MISLLKYPILLVVLCLTGCTHILAEKSVKAPNLQKLDIVLPPTPPELTETLKSAKQMQIPVGPPDATLAVWITPASRARLTAEVKIIGSKVDYHTTRTPATMPSTGPSIRGTIFLLHGILDHQQLGPYLLYKECLTASGFKVVQVDLRGHGRSTGKWITYGVVESHDLVQVLDELEKQGQIDGPVGALGFSYGGAVAIQWAAIDPRVKAIVALEPFATYRDAAHDAAPLILQNVRWLFSDKDIDRAVDLSGKKAGFDPALASPLDAITKTKAPVMLFHSRADELVSYHQSERLRDAAPDRTELILVENQSHFWMWLQSLDTISNTSIKWFIWHFSRQ